MANIMEDKRAHERISIVDEQLKLHLADHNRFEEALLENTLMTRQIAENTTEIVAIFKGVKGFRTFIVWVAPLLAASVAVVAWIKTH